MTDTLTNVEVVKERLRLREHPVLGASGYMILAPDLDCVEALATITDLQAKLDEARQEIKGYQYHLRECEQVAGKALGYPWFKDDPKNFPEATEADGVCVGEHIGETIVEELVTKLADVTRERDEARDALRQLSKFAVLSGSRYIMVAHELSSEVTALLTAQNSALHLPSSDVCHQPDGRLSGGDEPAPYSLAAERRLALAEKVVEAAREMIAYPWKSLAARQALTAYDIATKYQPETEGEG